LSLEGKFSVRTKTPHLTDRMLDAAARLFGTQRFHEARMDDIAAEAEVSKGTLYRYFKDKEELYLALLDRCSRDLVALLHERVAAVEGPRARLEAFVAALIAFFDAQPHLLDLIQRAEVLRGPGQPFPWQQARDANFRLCREIFQEGEREGAFPLRDPEQAALMLLGGLRSVIRFGARPRRDDLAQSIVSDFLHGAART
jgi:AcrR family transcriptional regulator